jgi:hypothetical protein
MGSRTSLGLRVKTGRAIAVILGGDLRAPHVLERRELALFDPEVPESKQPFHAGLELPREEAERVVGRACDAVRSAAKSALAALDAELRSRDLEIEGVGLVRSSDRDPASIRNAHMRAHASEGHLFHGALAEAVQARGTRCISLLEKHVLRDAASCLGRSEADVRRAVVALGSSVGSPWRADEKAACAAAWFVLAQSS